MAVPDPDRVVLFVNVSPRGPGGAAASPAKFAHYRRIPSLRHYLLVSQHERRIDYYTKTENRRWELDDADPQGVVRLVPGVCSFCSGSA